MCNNHTFSINTQTQYDNTENSEIFTRKLLHFDEPLNSTIHRCILAHDIQYQEVVNLKSIFYHGVGVSGGVIVSEDIAFLGHGTSASSKGLFF